MKKLDLLRKKMKLSGDTSLIVPVFSEETYVKCKIGSVDDFYGMPCVEDMANEIFYELNDIPLEKIIFGAIDEDYFQYLSKHKLLDNATTRNNYITSLSESQKKLLWSKSEHSKGYDWGIIPIIIENNTYIKKNPDDVSYDFMLTQETISQLKETIFESFNRCEKEDNVIYNIKKDKMYIAPYIIDVNNYNNDQIVDELFDEGIECIENKKSTINYKYSQQYLSKETPLAFFGIFFMFEHPVPYDITKEYIENAKETTINRPLLDVNLIEKILSEDINVVFELLTLNVIYLEYVNDAIEKFRRFCIEKIEENANTLKNMNNLINSHCKTKPKKKK